MATETRHGETVVLSHTYVEPANRGKLHALARTGPVTAVIPRRWREGQLGRRWESPAAEVRDGVRVEPVRWLGPHHPSLGLMRAPRTLLASASVFQVEEEPWTPTALLAVRGRTSAARVLFTWENLDRDLPLPLRLIRSSTLRGLDGLIAGNDAAELLARRHGFRGPAAVIPQLGVALPEQPSPRTPSPILRVAYVGRLVPEKGVDVLLRALAAVAAPWSLAVVGDGPERAALERLAAALGVRQRVVFRGTVPHASVAEVWQDTDVLVLPSVATPRWSEQFGHVLVEAMAHGVACVGSSCGAIPAVIGDAGLVFPEGQAAALAGHLASLASDGALVARLGGAGRARVRALYTDDRIAERTREFHDEVLRGLKRRD